MASSTKSSCGCVRLFLAIISVSTSINVATGALRCGNCGQNPVPYPLSTGPDCGDQAYRIKCNAGTLWFETTQNSSYLITKINPATQKLIIRPAETFANSCIAADFHSEGIRLDQNLPFNITGANTVLLLNCTDALLHLQVPINCSTNCICHSYLNNTPSLSACNLERLCCMFRTGGSASEYMIRVHSDGCMAYQSFPNLDPTLSVAKWPDPGVELMWATPDEPSCKSQSDCHRDLPYSSCLQDPARSGQKRCYCERGRFWDLSSGGYCRKCHPGSGCTIHKSKAPLIGVTVGAVVVLAISGYLVYRQQIGVKKQALKVLIRERKQILNANNSGKLAKIFSGKVMKKATNNFAKENLLGSGGFGEVYKATLDDGTVTAVKRAKPGNAKGINQVLNEVRILCQVNHKSLVRLLGCCVELEQPLLIYEYVPNGTLFDHLHGFRRRNSPRLSWFRRLMIAFQTADGVAYLHSSAIPPIYHRDVKSSNILLDENLGAKVSDFGLSRLVDTSERECSHVNTSAQGTLGYLDPEYYMNLQLTDRSDVYSFGVVLMELLTSQKVIDFNRDEENVNLVVYMKKIMDEQKLMDVIDPAIKEGAGKVELETMIAIGNLAAACLDERRQNRPSMKEVADEIEYIISIISVEGPKSKESGQELSC